MIGRPRDPVASPPGKKTSAPIERRLFGRQSWSGRFEDSAGVQTPDRLARRLDNILTMPSRLYVVKCARCVILASRMLHPVSYSCLVSAPPTCDIGSVYSHPFPLCATPTSHPLATWHSDRPVRRSTAKNIHRVAGSAACDRHSVRAPSVRGGGGVTCVVLTANE